MALTIRLAGQILGALVAALFVILFIGEGHGKGPGFTPTSIALYVAVAGCLLGLWKPLPGGVLALLGTAAFYALNYAGYQRLPGGPVFPLFWVAGALMLIGSLLQRKGNMAG